MRLVHYRDYPTSTAEQLMAGDLLHFKSLEGCRNVALSAKIHDTGRILGEVVEHVLRQTRRLIFRHVFSVARVGTGLQPATRLGGVPGMVEGRSL